MLSTNTYGFRFKTVEQVEYFLNLITEVLPQEYQTEYSVSDLRVEMEVPEVVEEIYHKVFLAARKIAA